MPTYDYECTACSHTFEKYQMITARRVRKCPRCGGVVRRLIGAGAGIIFKGSGFYETDYKRKRPAPAASGEKSSAAKTDTANPESKPESKSESNPESKPESKPGAENKD